ncbi:MAG: TFIIB-type zinc ribbon-containing protein [Lachnospiraceae bacterium]|nr:TFIIB-type zinc ribbon-containing protein [Lachnospiraceae bacterium]
MIIKCPNCNGAITYDPALADLMCQFCGSIFLTKDFTVPEEAAAKEESDGELEDDVEMMECEVYHCTSCAAQLIINDVESATFCAYCGQPTVVFDRVAKQRKPDFILPFSVSKKEALAIIRKHLSKGAYIPQEIKDFRVDTLRGIYVPFWLFDIYCHDNQYLTGEIGSGNNARTYLYYREVEHTFKKITVDASRTLNDESSVRLEPYDMKDLKSFSAGYLSGFYADCSDEFMEVMEFTAVERAKKMFNQEIRETIPAHSIKVKSSAFIHELTGKYYALLPAWFLVFWYKERPYTIMVNGQTGKMVGAVPVEKKKVHRDLCILSTGLSVLLTVLFWYLLEAVMNADGFEEEISQIIGIIFTEAVISVCAAFKSLAAYKKSQQLTEATEIKSYVSDRQGGRK